MIGRRTISFCAVAVLGIFLMGQDCAAQCDPDPCQSITSAVAGTCTEIGGSCTGPSDYMCSCDSGYAWQDASNTCEELPPVGMAEIPGGCFDMGDHFAEGNPNELPVHTVCITAFEMDVYEVTNEKYAACVDAGGCAPPAECTTPWRPEWEWGDPAYSNYPVKCVTWNQAVGYCGWAGKRLPTEAERESAARGGLVGKRYPWGDEISCADARYYDCAGDTVEVGSYPPNGYGLYDMAGNVEEWVNDWYFENYYSISPTNDPPGPASGTKGIQRGGGWTNSSLKLRVSHRNDVSRDAVDPNDGFRCARGGAYGP